MATGNWEAQYERIEAWREAVMDPKHEDWVREFRTQPSVKTVPFKVVKASKL